MYIVKTNHVRFVILSDWMELVNLKWKFYYTALNVCINICCYSLKFISYILYKLETSFPWEDWQEVNGIFVFVYLTKPETSFRLFACDSNASKKKCILNDQPNDTLRLSRPSFYSERKCPFLLPTFGLWIHPNRIIKRYPLET